MSADKVALPEDLATDTEAVIAALTEGKSLDPGVRRRVRERGDRIREEVRRQNGLLDIGVPTIRALRDGDEG